MSEAKTMVVACPFTGDECSEGCINRWKLWDAVLEKVGYERSEANELATNAIGNINMKDIQEMKRLDPKGLIVCKKIKEGKR